MLSEPCIVVVVAAAAAPFSYANLLLQGNEILSNLTQEQYERVLQVLESAILATDLALYFRLVLVECVSDRSVKMQN